MTSKTATDMEDNMYIYSVKMSLQKCGESTWDIFGRKIQKTSIFPIIRVKYRNANEIEYNGISKTYDLSSTGLTEKNWEGACCGVSYFLISNTKSYSLYDKNGIFIKRLYVKDAGTLVAVGASHFVTMSSDGIERVWGGDGNLIEENTLTPEQILELNNNKVFRKGEFIC